MMYKKQYIFGLCPRFWHRATQTLRTAQVPRPQCDTGKRLRMGAGRPQRQPRDQKAGPSAHPLPWPGAAAQ